MQIDFVQRERALLAVYAVHPGVNPLGPFAVIGSADLGEMVRGGPVDGMLDEQAFEVWVTQNTSSPFASCAFWLTARSVSYSSASLAETEPTSWCCLLMVRHPARARFHGFLMASRGESEPST